MQLIDVKGRPVEKGAQVVFKSWVFATVTESPAIAAPGPGGAMVVTYRFEIIMPIPEQKGIQFAKLDDLLVVEPAPKPQPANEDKSAVN